MASYQSIGDGRPRDMLATYYEEYGGIDVVKVGRLPTPSCGSEHVLVKVHAASLNPADWKQRAGSLKALINRPMPIIFGFDVAGVIVEVGDLVDEWKVGDEVFGDVRGLETGTESFCAAPSGSDE